ncbi:MAG: LCP family protein [Clostridiales bacterium]|jgi:LCP family protein required for cell wall assembly|nr:LCP family protein [Clostridiales bacterium]
MENEKSRCEPAKIQKKSFAIGRLVSSLSAVSVFTVSGWMIARNVIRPPEIPRVIEAAVIEPEPTVTPTLFPADKTPETNDGGYAYLAPDGAEEDMNVGKGTHAPEGFTSEDRKEEFYTFLIIGLDGGINTDTIMVASYDAVNMEANIISIPRDSLVDVKRGTKKINAAYAAGTLYGERGVDEGIAQLRREVKTIIGFSPDFYVCVDLEAFVKIVDAVGGVDVFVPLNMKYDDPEQNLHINIPKGEQHLDGADALRLARYRKGNDDINIISDYDRIENQQAVIRAILENLLKPSNITKIPEFIDIFNEYVYTDIKIENMLWFAEQLNKIKGTDALSTYTMPTAGTSGPPMYYEYLYEYAIVEMVNETINPFKKDIDAKDLDIITWY